MSLTRSLILSLSLLALASCGFKPVYGKASGNVTEKLASVRVEEIPNRDGQILQYKLVDLLTPTGKTAAPEYSLKIDLKTTRTELGIRGDLRVTRYDIIKTAKYSLVQLDTNKEVDSGRVVIKSSYNRTVSEFSTFVGEEDAGEKAAQEVAQEIRSRLIYYFSE